MQAVTYPYTDLRDYIDALDRLGLLTRVTEPVNKDTELVPLVRLQFRGLPERDRRAFLFEQITDSRGRSFDASVAIATYAASPSVYAAALGGSLDDIGAIWQKAFEHPIPTTVHKDAPCKEVRMTSAEQIDIVAGVDSFPHPISTPGFDNAPFMTASQWVTRDPETGDYNVGVYRGMIKGPRHVGLQMDTPSQHIAIHLAKARRMAVPLEAAIVVGGVPALGLAAVQKVPYGVNEYEIAGGLMGRSLDTVRAESVDIEVPATAELVIEGKIDPNHMELEGPFGEASGYMGPRTVSPVLDVTAITHRTRPIVQAFISEYPPSESTCMRKIGFQHVYRRFLRQACNINSVVDVTFYEAASCNMMFVIRLAKPSVGQAWQALNAAAGYEPSLGKIIIAVDDDIDPENLESVVWALSFRTQPRRDMRIIDNRLPRLDPSEPQDSRRPAATASAILIDATRSRPYPPTSLPTKPYMDAALARWESLGLPSLTLAEPWYGYELGEWTAENRHEAAMAEVGRYLETGAKLRSRPLNPLDPE